VTRTQRTSNAPQRRSHSIALTFSPGTYFLCGSGNDCHLRCKSSTFNRMRNLPSPHPTPCRISHESSTWAARRARRAPGLAALTTTPTPTTVAENILVPTEHPSVCGAGPGRSSTQDESSKTLPPRLARVRFLPTHRNSVPSRYRSIKSAASVLIRATMGQYGERGTLPAARMLALARFLRYMCRTRGICRALIYEAVR
jgi:hypothetical protein